ncbi:MAG: cytochrome c [Bradymonadaceae bacterium]
MRGTYRYSGLRVPDQIKDDDESPFAATSHLRASAAFYLRGLTHLVVDDYRLRLEPSPGDAAAAVRLEPTSQPLVPDAKGEPIRLSARTVELFDRHLEQTPPEKSGRALYEKHCVSCHQSDGKGTRSFPSLAGAASLNGKWTAGELIRTVLFGSEAEVLKTRSGERRSSPVMPRFGSELSPEQLARLLQYVTSAWGNDGPSIATADVRRIGCATDAGFSTYFRPGIDEDEVASRLAAAEKEGNCKASTLKRLERLREKTADQTNRAKAIYRKQCASCHGDEGRGNGPASTALDPAPTNFHEPEFWKHGTSPTEAFRAISEGIDGTAMRAYRSLSMADRWRLAHYVIGMLPEKARTEAASPGDRLRKVCRRRTAWETMRRDPCEEASDGVDNTK